MKNLVSILFLFFLLSNCGSSAQKNDKISLIFLRSDVPDIGIVKEIKEELYVSQFTDSVTLKGEEYPVLAIVPDLARLEKFGITVDDIYNVLKTELNIPVIESEGKSEITYRQKDFEQNYRNRSFDELMGIIIKTTADGGMVYLKDIAKIRLQLHEDPVFYHGDPVYIITFKFYGKNRDELKKIFQSIDKIGVKYTTVYE